MGGVPTPEKHSRSGSEMLKGIRNRRNMRREHDNNMMEGSAVCQNRWTSSNDFECDLTSTL